MNDQERFEEALDRRDRGDYPGAQQVLEQLLPDGPQSSALFGVLGDVYWEQGLLNKAVEAFRRSTELAPRSETASLGLFHTLWEAGRREEALTEIRRFLSVADSTDYRNILAELSATR